MHRTRLTLAAIVCWILPAALLVSGPTAWLDRVHPRILAEIGSHGEADGILVTTPLLEEVGTSAERPHHVETGDRPPRAPSLITVEESVFP